MTKDRLLIGVAERIDLPDWGITGLKAKIDTGARTSAVHVEDLVHLGRNRVRFRVLLSAAHDARGVWVEARVVRRAHVRPSSGVEEERLFVRTRLKLGALEKDVEVSLAYRGPMRFRMLLGRTALGSDVLIDPSRRYLATPRRLAGKGAKKAAAPLHKKKKPKKTP